MSIRSTASPFLLLALVAAALCACDTSYDAGARSERNLTEGIEALVAGEFERAWPLCDEARRLRPEEPAAQRCVALAAVGWGRWDLAARDLQVLLERGDGGDPEPWISVTLWLARVRIGDAAGAARIIEDLGDGDDAERIRQGILALALAEGADTPAWGFTDAEVGTWRGILPLIREGRIRSGEDLSPPRPGEDLETTGYRAFVAALEGKASHPSADDAAVPAGVRILLTAAAGEIPTPLPAFGGDGDPSLILLGRFFGGEGGGGCSFSEDLSAGRRLHAAAALLEGVCLERRGDLEAAIVRYDEAVSLAPWNRVARLDRALLMARTGRFAAARVELRHLSGDEPGHPLLRVLEGLLAGIDGEHGTLDEVRTELAEIAPVYGAWMDEVLAE
ncbi:MAG: tetratricopeptide repeat protein [Pseudomonadota bacterium]